jgi:DNA polymerase III delta prime subunit
MNDTFDNLAPERFGSAFKAFMDAVLAAASPPQSPLLERIAAHLGVELSRLPVISEEFDSFEHPNLQVALDAYVSQPGREAELVGFGLDNKRFMQLGLSDLISHAGSFARAGLTEGPVDYVNFRLAGDRVLACVQFGLYLISEGAARLVVFLAGPVERGPRARLRVEVLAADPADAQAFLGNLMETMVRLNVYRGQIISLSPGQFGMGAQTLVAFHTLPDIRSEDVVLPAGLLERVERQTIGFAQHAELLRQSGRSLKRGLLLYGPPGVGKILTIMYLTGRMPGRTTILTTGRGIGLLQPVAQLARQLAPSMVVLEDVDLIAEDRGMPRSAGPLLFELLNEMDGLSDDSDVIFILTTNRPEILEPALAARPGRIDLAVELPLPDQQGRERLLELYARGLQLRDVDLGKVAEQIAGVTPAYIKELLRKAALLAAEDGMGAVVSGSHLEAARLDLDEGGRLAQRLLGFRPNQEPPSPGGPQVPRQPWPTGFPQVSTGSNRIIMDG